MHEKKAGVATGSQAKLEICGLGAVCPPPPHQSMYPSRLGPPCLARSPRESAGVICPHVRPQAHPTSAWPHRDTTVPGCVYKNENKSLIQSYPNYMTHFPNHTANSLFSQPQNLIRGCAFCLPGFISDASGLPCWVRLARKIELRPYLFTRSHGGDLVGLFRRLH